MESNLDITEIDSFAVLNTETDEISSSAEINLMDKDFWKYVRLQMLWLNIVGFLCGIYEILMGSIGVFIIDLGD